ncbi:hypothetical protein H0H93_001468, partial [Arthromyces matolae]
MWVSYQPFLLSQGYKLRPRYSPDWKPSWKDSDDDSQICLREDSITPWRADVVMDAKRAIDNSHVVLKRVMASSQEVQIAQFLSSPALASDPRNHTVPLLATIYHPEEDVVFLVMPVLLDMNFLPFRRLGEFAEA